MTVPKTHAMSLSRPLNDAENEIVFEWIADHGNCVKLFETLWIFQSPFSAELLLSHFHQMLPRDVQAFVCSVNALAEVVRVDRSGLDWLWREQH